MQDFKFNVLDEIRDLIEPVSEEFPTYICPDANQFIY